MAPAFACLPAKSKRVPQLQNPLPDGFSPIDQFAFHNILLFLLAIELIILFNAT